MAHNCLGKLGTKQLIKIRSHAHANYAKTSTVCTANYIAKLKVVSRRHQRSILYILQAKIIYSAH